MRLEWNEHRGEKKEVRAVRGQGRARMALWATGKSWASPLNEVGAMGVSWQRDMP